MDVDLLKQRKLELGLTNQQLSSLSGVSLGTINKIFSGATQSPRLETVEALSSALGLDFPHYHSNPLISRMREPFPAYKQNIDQKANGSFTMKDLQTLPDDTHAELIDGYLITNETPSVTHQGIVSELCYYLKDYIKKSNSLCKVFVSPIGVRLDKDDKTFLEPDLIILCDSSKKDDHYINGAPDFVVEVVSPSSRSRDYLVKLNKYYYAGVREYWIVDPKHQTVSVYWFDNSEEDFDFITYTFDSPIPVRIFDNLVINFKELDF